MEFIKILKNSKNEQNFNSESFMKQMNNGIIITGGIGDSINIINDNYDEIKKISYIENLKEKPPLEEQKEIMKYKKTLNISEKINNSDSKEIELIDFSKYGLLIYELNLETSEIILKRQNKKISCKECFEMNIKKGNNNVIEYIAMGEKVILHLTQNFEEKINKKKKINTPYSGAIKISDKLIALISNEILLSNGEDKLVFYDVEQKEIKQTIKGFFTNSLYGISLVEIKENETKGYKILICACKNYNSNKKNGIFLVKPSIEEDDELSYKFEDTRKFEVNCICPIHSEDKGNTIFFFAGGLETERNLGWIKLYKFIYDHESNSFDITFLQDINIGETNIKDNEKELKGFENSISCMLQNKKDKNILVGTSDGKVYVFSEPNLKYYIEEYEERQLHLFN